MNYKINGIEYPNPIAPVGDWQFIEQFLPDYFHSDQVLLSDDLSCYIDGEMDDERKAKFEASHYLETMDQAEHELADLFNDLKFRAMEAFINGLLDGSIELVSSKTQQPILPLYICGEAVKCGFGHCCLNGKPNANARGSFCMLSVCNFVKTEYNG